MSRFKLGLQLYSVRDFMEQDMEATLKAVSEMGYECVEFAGYFGKTAEEVKDLCEKGEPIEAVCHFCNAAYTFDPEEIMTEYVKKIEK